jgi:magnesium-transporting ATPase (P-type)
MTVVAICMAWSIYTDVYTFKMILVDVASIAMKAAGTVESLGGDMGTVTEGVTGPCDLFTSLRAHPQSLALSVLVTIEMLKAFSAVSLDNSLLQLPFWKNKYLLLGVTLPFLLHLAVLYIAPVAKVFGLAALSWREWKVSYPTHI